MSSPVFLAIAARHVKPVELQVDYRGAQVAVNPGTVGEAGFPQDGSCRGIIRGERINRINITDVSDGVDD
jgi:hypothetical protein